MRFTDRTELNFGRNFGQGRTLALASTLSFLLTACGLDQTPQPAQGSTLSSSTQASSTTSRTQAPRSNDEGTQSSGSSSSTRSGPPADCVGLNPEGQPDDEIAARQADPLDSSSEPSGTASTSTSESASSQTTSTPSGSTESSTASSTDSDTPSDSGSTDTGPDTGTDSTGEGGCIHPACIGDSYVSWELHDHQPRSCGFGQDYGQDIYFEKTTMVVFLAGWCNFCLRQTVGLEKMRIEWAREGKDISILIVNAASANSIEYRSEIVNRTSNPVFQDTNFANVWGAMQGIKDTFYIYDSNGILREFWLPGGDVNIDLSSPEGYATVKKRAEMVLEAQG